MPESQTPETPSQPGETQKEGILGPPAVAGAHVAAVATTGKRQAFRDIRRQLEEQELSSPGVQKLLLEQLETADSKCEVLEGYIERFHEADKRAAIFQEKLRGNTALEICFGTGVGLGCALLGMAPSLWDNTSKGPIVLSMGILLVAGAALARIVKQ